MGGRSRAGTGYDGAAVPPWQTALEELERSLREASRAVAELRRCLDEGGAGTASSGAESRESASTITQLKPVTGLSTDDSPKLAALERIWERIENERLEKQPESTPEQPSARRGLDLLPQQYLVTVEDRESSVDLVPLHRALLSLAKMEDISLVSFANGVPVISVRVEGDLDLERLKEAVSAATGRHCEIIPQDTGRLFLRLTSRPDGGG